MCCEVGLRCVTTMPRVAGRHGDLVFGTWYRASVRRLRHGYLALELVKESKGWAAGCSELGVVVRCVVAWTKVAWESLA